MINPPVVNKNYELLAGERRLKACQALGWEQIPVTIMDTRDAEHELNIEISENDVRKGFSKAERVDYMKRLLRIEKAKAGERVASTQFGSNTAMENFPLPGEKGLASDKTGAVFGISGKQMKREISIVENKDLLDPEDFANWDEGKLSTNKAFQKVKAELEKLRNESREVIKEVPPADYEKVKAQAKMADAHKKDFQRMKRAYDEMAEKWKTSESEKEKLIADSKRPEVENEERIQVQAFSFCSGMSNFLEKYGGYEYLLNEIDILSDREKRAVYDGIRAIYRWAEGMLNIGITEVIE